MPTDLSTPYRSHTCGQLRAADAGISARLSGWVHRRRDHGQLIFLDLRDRHGITQVVVNTARSPEAHAGASRIRSEFVVSASGEVDRGCGNRNLKLPTGEIELRANAIEILSEIEDPAVLYQRTRRSGRRERPPRVPLPRPAARADAAAAPAPRRIVQMIREVHHENGCIEIETPTLIKSTPEGAREYVVPSRLQPGSV